LKVCVLIPVHNESKNIGRVIKDVLLLGIDVIVIDDGSMDESGRIAREAGATVFRNEVKSGKGYSLRRGFEYLLQNGYDGVITMDGDGQHDVGDLNEFLHMAQVHNGVVTGNRMANSKGMPWLRLLTNRFMSGLISLACRQNVPDTQCGYRYISVEVLKKIQLKCNGFEIETEIIMKAAKKEFITLSVPIKTIYQGEKSHIHPIRDTVRFFVYFFKEAFSSDS
jgi:glycosyltransferase involved in cell wall biosynthesis